MTRRDVHVVIVDDDQPVRRALARLLTSAGFRVSVCGSAEDFLTRSYELAPTCLLLDVHLPRLSGLQLNHVLARLDTRVPIVFITADQEVARSAEMRRAGRACLIKPIDDEALLEAISTATAQA
jgi:FixJ family two-component response regulator